MSSPFFVVAGSAALIAMSAFFVAVEFAAISAKRHRLEDAAEKSLAARAALRNSSELTVLLAGSQLGITVCTLALGAFTKPAVHHALLHPLENIAPHWVAEVGSFVLALLIVTFLHLVVGEMAPKSWAIAHPERSATMLATPMRGFMFLFRPVLRLLNELANRCVMRFGVQPVDHVAAGHSAADLRHLVEHSANVGALDPGYSAQLAEALALEQLKVGDVMASKLPPTSVPIGATVAEVRRASLRSGHRRILVGDLSGVAGVVHVRDTLAMPLDADVTPAVRDTHVLASSTPVYAALTELRQEGIQLALVEEGGRAIGVVSLVDLMNRLLPQR